MNNPFNISFGEKPLLFISRSNEFDNLVSSFKSDNPESKIYIITGPRGCGKTVSLSTLKKYFENEEGWVCVDINPYSDTLEQLAAKIIDKVNSKHLSIKAELTFSFSGISFTLKGDKPINNIESLLDNIFKILRKKHLKVLITIDDICCSNEIKKFIYSFQSFLREGYPSYLLMSGLYENVSDIQNDKSLTYLLRAPKIELSKLNIREIAYNYKTNLDINDNFALQLAICSKGYAYGYQLLGNIMYKLKARELNEEVLHKYDIALEDNVYSKIWESLTDKEKEFLIAMSESKDLNAKDIISKMNINNAYYQQYRKRLIKNGIIEEKSHGQIDFLLPRFKEYVLFQKTLLEYTI